MGGSRKPAILQSMKALADTLLPRLNAPDTCSNEVKAFYEWSGGADSNGMEDVLRMMKRNLSTDQFWGLTSILWLLSTRLGTLVLAGTLCLTWRFPFVLSFIELSVEQREKVLQSLASSPFNVFKGIFMGLKNILFTGIFSSYHPEKNNPWVPVVNFKYPDSNPRSPSNPEAQKAETLLGSAVTDLQEVSLQVDNEQLVPYLKSRGLAAALPTSSDKELTKAQVAAVIEVDAVVVGSGPGGSVTAATLANAGLSVLVLEKSSWMRSSEMTWQERQAWDAMYENGGTTMSEDASVAVVAGSTLGGGTKINWAGSLRLPDTVRQEWADRCGLPVFTTDRFTKIQDAVCERLRVNGGVCEHSGQAAAFKKGLEAQGLHVQRYDRNCVGESCSSMCAMGCREGNKMSGDITFLADAVQDGARILTGTYAERLLRDNTGAIAGVLISDGGRSSSIPYQPSMKIFVKAKVVVSSCGSLHTPALLLRSGITVNGNVGSNFRIHPCSGLIAVFPKGVPSDQWDGAPMTVLSKHLSNREGTGYGAVLITPAMQPGMFTAVLPWTSGQQFKDLLARADTTALGLVVVRDTGSGTVGIDDAGRPTFKYWLSPFDQDTLIEGIVTLANIWAAAGAEKLVSGCLQGWTYDVDEHHTPERLKEFTDKIRKAGVRPTDVPIFSAHQMSSCSMGTSPKTSACDPQGQVWGVEGLYVADGSVMPTCSGVNPMISIYSISLLVAQNIAEKYGKKKKRGPVGVEYE